MLIYLKKHFMKLNFIYGLILATLSLVTVKLNENIIIEQSLKGNKDQNLVKVAKISSYITAGFRLFEPLVTILLYAIILWSIVMIIQNESRFSHLYQQLSHFYFIAVSGEAVLLLYDILGICKARSLFWMITANLFLTVYLFFTLRSYFKNFANFSKTKQMTTILLAVCFILGLGLVLL
ncbi:MAG: hypothetical protein LBF32_04880 [Streptococcaceae bacterium]|jgi:hypothetical protein|nr:hypothetical protein [Streptococcaceae bacterium]